MVEGDEAVNRPFIIAEMSASHLGSLDHALKIVDAAAYAGADAIKTQTWTPGTMVGQPGYVLKDGPWAGRKMEELYAEAWLPWDWHRPIFDRARAQGMEAFSSVFDPEALTFLESLNVPRYKIASFELVDSYLVQLAASTGKPLILSCGMAKKDEIFMAVQYARAAGCKELTLLKCTSAYPAKIEDANLSTIRDMWDSFGCEVGLSDHTPGPVVAMAATAMGAAVIEKHLTLKRSDGGPDAGFSMEPDEFAAMVTGCRKTYAAMGRVKYGPSSAESAQVGLRRSLYLAKDVRAGEVLTRQCVVSGRPALGLNPLEWGFVDGGRFAYDVPAGKPLSKSMVQCTTATTGSVPARARY